MGSRSILHQQQGEEGLHKEKEGLTRTEHDIEP